MIFFKQHIRTLVIAATLGSMSAAAQFTHDMAVTLALTDHPALHAAVNAVEEEAGHANQAGLPPNPEIELGIEAWSGKHRDDSELLAGISQRIPVSGVRRTARQAGMIAVSVAEQEAASKRIEITTEASLLFYEALAAQERHELLIALGTDMETIVSLTRARLEHGDMAEVDLMRALADQARCQADTAGEEKELTALYAQLASLCRVTPPEVRPCVGEIAPEEMLLPDEDALIANIRAHPRGKARMLRVEQARKESEVLRRAAMPDPIFRVGLRRQQDTNENALDFGFSIGLPLFDRNQGARAASRARAARLLAEQETMASNEERRGLALLGEAHAALTEAQQLRIEVVPKLEAIDSALQNALEIGGATLFEVLAARRDATEARLALSQSKRRARIAVILLSELMGM